MTATIFIILIEIIISCLIFVSRSLVFQSVEFCHNQATEESYKDQSDSHDANRIKNPLSWHKFRRSCANSRKMEQWDRIFGSNFFFPQDHSCYAKPDEIIIADLRIAWRHSRYRQTRRRTSYLTITKPVLGVIVDKGYLNRRDEVQPAVPVCCQRVNLSARFLYQRQGEPPPRPLSASFYAIFSYRRNVKANALRGLYLKFEYRECAREKFLNWKFVNHMQVNTYLHFNIQIGNSRSTLFVTLWLSNEILIR